MISEGAIPSRPQAAERGLTLYLGNYGMAPSEIIVVLLLANRVRP